MSEAYETIKALLPKLEEHEVKEIKSLLSLVGKVDAEKKDALREEVQAEQKEELLYIAIRDFLYKTIRINLPKSLVYWKRHKTRRDLFMQTVALREKLDDYGKEWLGNQYNRTRQQRLYRLYCKLAGKRIMNHNYLTLSFTSLISFGEEFPGMVDNAFPGYIKAGLIHIALDASVSKNR